MTIISAWDSLLLEEGEGPHLCHDCDTELWPDNCYCYGDTEYQCAECYGADDRPVYREEHHLQAYDVGDRAYWDM
jgi:hypothetical protein